MQTPHQVSADEPAPLVSLTAREIVDALDRQGLPIVNPVDATAAECPGIGCTQAVVTGRFRIYEFATSGAAQIYAGSQKTRQAETVVVTFAPVVGQAERDRYWSAIVRLVR